MSVTGTDAAAALQHVSDAPAAAPAPAGRHSVTHSRTYTLTHAHTHAQAHAHTNTRAREWDGCDMPTRTRLHRAAPRTPRDRGGHQDAGQDAGKDAGQGRAQVQRSPKTALALLLSGW